MIPISYVAALAALVQSSLTPHSNGTAAFGSVLGAILFGVPGALLLRWSVGPVVMGKATR